MAPASGNPAALDHYLEVELVDEISRLKWGENLVLQRNGRKIFLE
jgi:hypothetical protein